MRRAVLALLLALLTLPPPGVAAEGPAEARWDYAFSVPDPDSGLVRVELRLSGMEGVVTRFTFRTDDRRDPVSNVTPGPATTLREVAGGFVVEVDGPESFAYDVDVGRAAFRAGERLAHAGPGFALFKAESVALAYSYTYYEGRALANRSTVTLVPPPGWRAAGPWNETAPGVFALEDGAVIPRGFVAFGPFRAFEERAVAGKRVQYVRLGAAAPFEPDLFAFVERATPYYEAVYGPSGAGLLVVSAPDPMLRGGLGAMGSLYVHEEADLRTVAHEYAHVHQRFGAQEAAGTSSVWLAEGDADWHGLLALHAAGYWTAARVDEALRDAERARTDPAFADARLVDATYGASVDGRSLERFAYHKGATVLRALDARLRQETDGGAGVPALLRRLNALHGDARSDAMTVENDEVAAEASRLAGTDLSAFFEQFVRGPAWPDAPRVQPAGELGVLSVRAEPARAPPGAAVEVVAEVVNEGTRRLQRDVALAVDGAPLASFPLDLAVGERRTLRANATAHERGDHEAALLHARAAFRRLSPASLALGNASAVPATPRAGEPFELLVFVENAGEMPARATVTARGVARAVDVPASGAAAVALPLLLNETGNVTLDISLISESGSDARSVPLAVAPPRKASPLPAAVALAAVLTALAARRRR